MDETKKWYASRTVWGGLIAFAAAVIAPMAGVTIDAVLQGDMVDVAVAGGGVIGSLIAIWGRLKASKTID